MDTYERTLEIHLKKAGYSLTNPRRLVFTALREDGPMTMQQLYRKLESVNRTTVYRVSNLFEELGIAQKAVQGFKYKLELTDDFVPHHHHFTCTKCHNVISFDEPNMLDAVLESVALNKDFKITGHSLEITGLCSDCQVKF